MTLAKQALAAVLAATWLVGLLNQDTWTMAITYLGISLAMAALVFGFNDRQVFKFAARRRNRGR